jgi:hypothetical protein
MEAVSLLSPTTKKVSIINMESSDWKKKKRQFLEDYFANDENSDSNFFKVDNNENQNKKYAAGTPWTTLIKDSSLVNSRVFVRDNYHNHDIFSTDDDLGNAILSCAVKKATYTISEETDRDYHEIYEAIKDYFSDNGMSGNDLRSIVKSLRDLDHEELFN